MDLISFIDSKIDERSSIGNDDSFYVFDLNDVRLKYQKWIEKIPRAVPFYAVKCNSEHVIVKALAELGTGFDCASMNEQKLILGMGVKPNRIIYANTIKQPSHLQFAADHGIEMVTFDCPAELYKIKKIHPGAKVVLRIRFDARHSTVRLGLKFGCDPITEAPDLIKMCKDLQLNLIGISFHVGSGTRDYAIYERALQAVRQLFDIADASFGYKLNFVDIGGGFLGDNINLMDNYAESVNKGIDKYFPDPAAEIISEPGRYFCESAFSLVVQIISKKISQDGRRHYYINEGISQSFMSAHLCKIKLQYKIVRKTKNSNGVRRFEYPSTVWGQTCDGLDVVIKNEKIPEIEIGDHMVFENMGAYSRSVSSNFNGFKIGEILVYASLKNGHVNT